MITITITAPANGQAAVDIKDPNDILKNGLGGARQLMIQALAAIEGEVGSIENCKMPTIALALLRNFLVSVGGDSNPKKRRLLLMALMQLDDEDQAKAFQKPLAALPILQK